MYNLGLGGTQSTASMDSEIRLLKLIVPLISCVILGKLLNCSEPQLIHMQNGNSNNSLFIT